MEGKMHPFLFRSFCNLLFSLSSILSPFTGDIFRWADDSNRSLAMKKRAFFLSVIAFYTFLLLPLGPLLAQELKLPPGRDIIPPEIQHEPSSEAAFAEKPLQIQATITDNVAIKEVTLYYRIAGALVYSSVNMERVEENLYSTTIPQSDVAIPGIEYYIQVSDPAGNVGMEGLSFSPLVVSVIQAPAPDKEEEKTFTETIFPPEEKEVALKSEPSLEKPWYKKWWVWAIAGAVVVGAAAAGGGGGGGGGDKGAGAPTSGTATVSGPIP
jgi:hypothetical protein